MKVIKGTSNRFLEIDLTHRKWKVFHLTQEDRSLYLGGKGLGLKLYYDRLSSKLKEVDPLGADNLICFMMGVFVGTGAPCSGRFEAITKSPLTGIMVTSSCGGPFGMACKTAGYDGVIVGGASDTPVTVIISDTEVEFVSAEDIWGLDTQSTQKKLPMSKKDGAVVIGPAGENQVLYANICSGHRFLGRGGMGAVMGSKGVKAIVTRGRAYKIEPILHGKFKSANKKANSYLSRNKMTNLYKKYGTNMGVNPGVDAGLAPIYNFRDRTDERFRNMSGEVMAERYKTMHSTCLPCSIACGHKGTYPDGKVRPIPEYETNGLFGGNIGNFDTDLVGHWNVKMNDLGLDTISTGATISWAMEANKRGVRPSSLEFDKFDNIGDILDDIAYKRGEGAELASGTKRLSDKYGGHEFAMQVKGLEMAAYDPRGAWGQGLNYAVTNRGGCHLGAYPVALEVFLQFLPPYSTRAKAKWVDYFENLYAAINSTHTCLFSAFGYVLEPPIARFTPRPILFFMMTYLPDLTKLFLDWSLLNKLVSSITGYKMSSSQYLKCGRRIIILERYMNALMGISKKDDTLPSRFLEEAHTKHKVAKVVRLQPMLEQYYKVKQYDDAGIPPRKLLKKLRII